MTTAEQRTFAHRVFDDHPALLVPLLYFVASLIGLLYSWAYLSRFGISVFQYADVSDFLLASLKEPLTWAFATAALAAVAMDNAMSRRVERKGPSRWLRWYGSSRYRRINVLCLVGLTATLLFYHALNQEERIRDGQAEIFTVQLADGSAPKQRVLLGTTARFVFLFDPATEMVDIHPGENILSLSHRSPARPQSKPD